MCFHYASPPFENTEFPFVPIYEYACRSCQHRFETIQKVSEPVLTDCPECGETTLKKLLSAPVFRLKGSGWYETDFKNANRKNVSDNGESGGGETAGTDETRGDGKSADASGSTDKAAGKDTKDTKDKGSKTPESKTTSSNGTTTSAAKAD